MMAKKPSKPDASPPPNDGASEHESQLFEMTYIDPAIHRPINNPEGLVGYFDQDGLFKVPEGMQADRWEDAQRFAAEALDVRDELIHSLNVESISPNWWGASEIEVVQELHELAEATVAVAARGASPPWREWVNVDRFGGFPFSFSDCVKAARQRAQDATLPEQPYPEEFRARFASLLVSGCRALAKHVLSSKRSGASKRDFQELPVQPTPGIHLLMIKKVDDLRNTARFMALAGQERRRKQTEGRENPLTRVEAVAEFLFRAVHHPDTLANTPLPAVMRPGAYGELKYQFETLAHMIDALGNVSPQERSGAALLVGATIYGWGAKTHEATFQAALERAQATARLKDEDVREMYKMYPVLRWKAALNNGLAALGHDTEQLSISAAKAAERQALAAKKATPPKRS